jgi:hypothetical protein
LSAWARLAKFEHIEGIFILYRQTGSIWPMSRMGQKSPLRRAARKRQPMHSRKS